MGDLTMIEAKFQALPGRLDESTLRIWAATEARSLGRGGVSAAAKAIGMRPVNEKRGINLITLYRSHGKVEKVEVDSYEFSEDRPVRAENSPLSCRV